MSDKKTVWQTLNEIDVTPYIKQKNNLDYLSWSVAVGLVKPYYPNYKVKVYENEVGFNYHTDGSTCWVKVGVEIEGIEEIEYLPVMDFKNKSILKDSVTSVDVNKSIKRAIVKALAAHGLGISLYAGEDLPSQTLNDIEQANRIELIKIIREFASTNEKPEAILEWACKSGKVQNIDDLSLSAAKSIMNAINAKKAKNANAQPDAK